MVIIDMSNELKPVIILYKKDFLLSKNVHSVV